MQNLVIANKDNLVVYVFGGIDLTLATDIQVQFGAESYSLINDPLIVIVSSATELSLNLSSTGEVGKVFSTVTYFDAGSVLGTDITSRELSNSEQIVVAIGTQLIIEDGSVVANANSWVTDAEYKAFAKLKGYSVPATQPDREANLANAYDFINMTYEQRLQGFRVDPAIQTGVLPRNGMVAYNKSISNDAIPKDFKNAQMLAAFSIKDGVDTNAVKTDADLASFTVVGVYAETYQANSNTPTLAQMPAVSRTLTPYTNAGLGGGLSRDNMGFLG
ncbi:MAG: hypothetical protein COA84_14915 [Robiginitomaculum sp.]|nr:MAG: hypothetical protein COA84_14915 [Robiginitomaculum sp.]